MKKNVLVFGLVSGIIITVMMFFAVSMCYNDPDFEPNMILGYAAMLAAFSFIFIGIKNYRDKYNDGVISFGRAFRIGLFITLIASTMYVVGWLIDYYFFVPDFMDKYIQHVLTNAEREGATAAELAQQAKDMADYKELYKNPVMVILITYSEVLPIGLIVTLISALILKKNPQRSAMA